MSTTKNEQNKTYISENGKTIFLPIDNLPKGVSKLEKKFDDVFSIEGSAISIVCPLSIGDKIIVKRPWKPIFHKGETVDWNSAETDPYPSEFKISKLNTVLFSNGLSWRIEIER